MPAPPHLPRAVSAHLPPSRSGCKALTTRCSQTSGAWACPWWSCPLEGTPSPRRTPRSWRPYLAGPWSTAQKESLTASRRGRDPPDAPSAVWPEAGTSGLDGAYGAWGRQLPPLWPLLAPPVPLGRAHCGQQSSDGPEASGDNAASNAPNCPVWGSCTCRCQLAGSGHSPLSQAVGWRVVSPAFHHENVQVYRKAERVAQQAVFCPPPGLCSGRPAALGQTFQGVQSERNSTRVSGGWLDSAPTHSTGTGGQRGSQGPPGTSSSRLRGSG